MKNLIYSILLFICSEITYGQEIIYSNNNLSSLLNYTKSENKTFIPTCCDELNKLNSSASYENFSQFHVSDINVISNQLGFGTVHIYVNVSIDLFSSRSNKIYFYAQNSIGYWEEIGNLVYSNEPPPSIQVGEQENKGTMIDISESNLNKITSSHELLIIANYDGSTLSNELKELKIYRN
ncbi:MAG: hypothetical protein K8I03_05720 [Ignavibacteria bacterium]|nr:hypothetical protein [Ignavibacteria bacterium]